MTPVPQVRASAYLPFVQFAEKLGARCEKAIDDELLPAVVYRDEEALVPMYLAHAFLARTARRAGAANLGYAVADQARIEGLGDLGRSLVRSLTLHDALGKLHRQFADYSSAEHIWWTRSGAKVLFLHRHVYDTGPGRREAQQCALLLMRDLIRHVAGSDWQPGEVLITPGHDVPATQQAFETDNVRRSATCGFAYPAEFLSQPFERFRAGFRAGEYASAAFKASAPAADFVGSVKQTIAALMDDGRCHLSVVAEAMDTHPRTLQRNLSECHHQYSDLLAEVRFEAATKLLEDPHRKVIDIAFDLGYSDPANFTRAFRQWTGISPSDFREVRADITATGVLSGVGPVAK